jgi:hypothetical protein
MKRTMDTTRNWAGFFSILAVKAAGNLSIIVPNRT